MCVTWLARRPPHTLLRKPVVASPLSENREHCRHLSHFPPQIWKIWKIAIQQVRSPAWWSETVRQHMNTTGLLNIGKGKPTKTNEFLDMFRRGRGGGGSKVSCFPMCPVLIFLFKLLKNIPWKYPFVSFLCQKSPVQKSKFCNINFWIGNDPPPPSELFRKFIRFGRDRLPLTHCALHYRARAIKEGPFRFATLASHFIRIQIFQIDLPPILSASKYFR